MIKLELRRRIALPQFAPPWLLSERVLQGGRSEFNQRTSKQWRIADPRTDSGRIVIVAVNDTALPTTQSSTIFLVLAAYASSVRILFFGLILVPLEMIFHPSTAGQFYGAYVSWFLWSTYFGLACAQLCAGNRVVSWLKGAIAAALTQLVVSVAISFIASIWPR